MQIGMLDHFISRNPGPNSDSDTEADSFSDGDAARNQKDRESLVG